MNFTSKVGNLPGDRVSATVSQDGNIQFSVHKSGFSLGSVVLSRAAASELVEDLRRELFPSSRDALDEAYLEEGNWL